MRDRSRVQIRVETRMKIFLSWVSAYNERTLLHVINWRAVIGCAVFQRRPDGRMLVQTVSYQIKYALTLTQRYIILGTEIWKGFINIYHHLPLLIEDIWRVRSTKLNRCRIEIIDAIYLLAIRKNTNSNCFTLIQSTGMCVLLWRDP